MKKRNIELDRKIDEIILETTSYYTLNENKKLDAFDKKVIEYYEKIIKIAKDENKENFKMKST